MEHNKSINNILIDNVLSKEQIERINKKALKYMDELPIFVGDFDKDGDKTKLTKIVNSFTGRSLVHCFELDNDIIDSFSTSLRLNGFDKYIYTNSTSYAEYSLKYGNPKLPEHRDNPSTVEHIVVDYQLDSNINWPVIIDNTEYAMQENSMLIFDGVKQYHSRPRIIFKDGEFVKVLLIRFDRIG
jgi:hypothetical protein